MKIPDSIKIVGTVYQIKQHPEPFADGTVVCDGNIEYCHPKIGINTDMDDQKIRRTLFHEVFHGIADAVGAGQYEDAIDRISNAWFQVWADNPDLFK